MIISAWWLRTSSKFTWEEVKTSTGKLGKWSTPKRVRIRPKYSAPLLSRDRRIKMHRSINHQYWIGTVQSLEHINVFLELWAQLFQENLGTHQLAKKLEGTLFVVV